MIVRSPSEPYSFPLAPDLEEVTGADLLISPLQAPVTSATVSLHLQAGALLVQVKRGLDLISSVGDRLWEALARMREAGARQWQAVLLAIGVFFPLPDGECCVAVPTLHPDGHVSWDYRVHPQGRPYRAVESSLRHWTWYGGVVVHLPTDDLVEGWVRSTEEHLLEKAAMRAQNRRKEVWPPQPEFDDPLVGLERVRDWRSILAAFPGIGPARATALRNAMLESGADDSLLQALIWATEGPRKVPGWGKATREAVKRALGLPDWARLSIEVEVQDEAREAAATHDMD